MQLESGAQSIIQLEQLQIEEDMNIDTPCENTKGGA